MDPEKIALLAHSLVGCLLRMRGVLIDSRDADAQDIAIAPAKPVQNRARLLNHWICLVDGRLQGHPAMPAVSPSQNDIAAYAAYLADLVTHLDDIEQLAQEMPLDWCPSWQEQGMVIFEQMCATAQVLRSLAPAENLVDLLHGALCVLYGVRPLED